MQTKSKLFIISAVLGSALHSFAQDSGHPQEIIELQQVNITASPFALKQEDLVIPADSLSGSKLRRSSQSSLGATLDGKPGVHSSSFAPGAGRPIIRGLDGDRVRILQNGTDVFDVSFTSPDHGVAVEPLLTSRIEVIRGPASLLYGNAAIGGVVNVIDKTLPRQALEGIDGEIELRYGSVAEEKTAGISTQGGNGEVVWSINYLKRDSKDYDIPGFAESEFLRKQEEEEDEDRDHEEEALFGTLENSAAESETLGLGLAWFGENASYAIAFNQYDSLYGVPGHAHEEEDEGEEHEEEEEESVVIDLENKRFSFRAEWLEVGNLFESVALDLAYADYRHTELEGVPGNQEVGTEFERDGFDLHLVGVHHPMGNLTGALGFHLKDESFSSFGEEAFIPANDLTNFAVFAVERYDTDWGAFEFGGRIENQSLSPKTPELANKDETTFNISAGVITKLEDNSTLAANLAYNERAPNASELYAFGPHAGTQSFEIGNPDLDVEQSLSLDLSWRKSVGFVTGDFTVFFSDFSDFVFLEHMDLGDFGELYPEEDNDGLDIFVAEAVDAEFYGFELDLRFHLMDTVDHRLHFDLLVDQTRATNQTEKSNLPRIPTRRIGGRLGYESGPWSLGIGVRHHGRARHLAPEETPADSYTLVSADLSYRVETSSADFELFAIGRNLSDQEARPHTSFVKDTVPLPGKSIEVGTRIFF